MGTISLLSLDQELLALYPELPQDKPPLIHADGCTTNLGIKG